MGNGASIRSNSGAGNTLHKHGAGTTIHKHGAGKSAGNGNVAINRHQYILSRAGNIIPRTSAILDIHNLIQQNNNAILIKAQSGAGKSTLIACLLDMLEKDENSSPYIAFSCSVWYMILHYFLFCS